MKRVLYLFTSGRGERIKSSELGNAPRDFLYGYTYLREQGLAVDYLETDHITPAKHTLEYWKLFYRNKRFARQLSIGSRSHYFVSKLEKLNSYDAIIATTDSIALGLAYFKHHNRLRSEIMYLSMGLAGALKQLKQSDKELFDKYKDRCGRDLRQCRVVWTAGKGEEQFLTSQYPEFKSKFLYSPWGIDLQFWKPNTSLINKEKYVLFVGNDNNRDFSQLLAISRERPNIQFIFVTSKIKGSDCGKNVLLYQGTLTNHFLSDTELRKLYNNASLIILPLKESLQPSGQSVSLQAMACARPVAITKTSGLWDSTLMRNNENCFLVTPGVRDFLEIIDELDRGENKFSGIGLKARQIVLKHHDGADFAAWINGIIQNYY